MREVRDLIRDRGRAAEMFLADLADPRQQELLVAQAWERSGGVDIWINNAGADVLTGESVNWSFEEKLDRLWRLDVVATMRLARMAGQRMQVAGVLPDRVSF